MKMNNLNIFETKFTEELATSENTFAGFKPTWTPTKNHWDNNCSCHCQAWINGYPFWINRQPFWPYKCACCGDYEFKKGQAAKGGFNV